jgi:hypothetical protein
MGPETGRPSSPLEADLWNDIRSENDKTARRAARQLVAAYHEQQLGALLEHIRRGFDQLEAGEIDVFGLDELIHRYHLCTQKLWSFCGSSGGQWLQAAKNLAYYQEVGEEPDWWAAGDRRRDR